VTDPIPLKLNPLAALIGIALGQSVAIYHSYG
jgi:hypothetical protein